jgi:hypothetical protein
MTGMLKRRWKAKVQKSVVCSSACAVEVGRQPHILLPHSQHSIYIYILTILIFDYLIDPRQSIHHPRALEYRVFFGISVWCFTSIHLLVWSFDVSGRINLKVVNHLMMMNQIRCLELKLILRISESCVIYAVVQQMMKTAVFCSRKLCDRMIFRKKYNCW